jgi:sugar phosphate isomerase/epimerase
VLNDCIQIAEEHQLALVIETVPCLKSTPLDVIRIVLEHQEGCYVALDTEFLAMHGQLEEALAADWLWSGKRIRHIHLKDYDGHPYDQNNYRRYLHPGEGSIDFADLINRLKQRHYAGNLSLEASVVDADGTRNIPKLRQSLESLQRLIQAERPPEQAFQG